MNKNERVAVVTLQGVYDNSDGMSDYYDPKHPVAKCRWLIGNIRGVVTEKKMRTYLAQLPKWMQNLTWSWQKGEKYSMSDHYHGQLHSSFIGDLTMKGSGGQDSKVQFLVDTMPEDLAINYIGGVAMPQTLDEFRALVADAVKPEVTLVIGDAEREKLEAKARILSTREAKPQKVNGTLVTHRKWMTMNQFIT